MTIVKNTASIRYHPFHAVDQDVADLITQMAESARKAANIRPPLKMLEAYCDITGQKITMQTLRSPAIEGIVQGFVTAMAGDALSELPDEHRLTFCRSIVQALSAAKRLHPDTHPLKWDFNWFTPDAATCEAIAANTTEFKRWYWSGWDIQRPNHAGTYLRLAQLVVPYGRDFVDDIYTALEKYYRNRTGAFRVEWNYMFDYLKDHYTTWPLNTFKTETGIKDFFKAFTLFHFKKAEAEDKDPSTQIKNWNRFLTGVENCLCKPSVWASLSSKIKRPPPSTKHGSQTKIYEDDEGLLVQEKLLTNIPLHVTDAEAVELLFFHIKNDLATVRGWATAQAADLKSRYTARISLAQKGTPIVDYTTHSSYKVYTLEDVCATLEEVGSTVPTAFLQKVYTRVTGEKCSAVQLAHAFGFPVSNSLFPLQCLLVLEHPEITTEFLKRFELYNENGALVGFDEAQQLLIGYKDRKQSDVREQTIHLNDVSVGIVKDIINITALARRTLRTRGNDDWRYLFITSGQAFAPLALAKITIWNEDKFANHKGLRDQILQQFRPHSDLSDSELVKFIKRVRLTKIRASRAVEVFIISKSSEQMSKALGHEHYYPDLLSHYLPDSIMAFIKARWIRIFQKAMVCEAMKESPYLLRVTLFTSMEELDTFLENHRIKEIPAEASDPERKASREEIATKEALLSISVPFLASLLSLEAAVMASSDRRRVCGKAEYWVSMADKIRTEILGGHERVLKKYLTAATKIVDAKKMEALIYVPAHWA